MLQPLSPLIWPWPHDAARRKSAADRYLLLTSQHEGLLDTFLRNQWGEARRAALGNLDTSRNTLATFAAALSTPGLYGNPPVVGHPDPSAADLIKPGGILESACWAAVMQQAEYFARGQGYVRVIPEYSPDGLALTLAHPQDLYVEVDPATRTRELRVFHLAVYLDSTSRPIYALRVWDVRDPSSPRFYVATLDHPETSAGESLHPRTPALVGDAYPYRRADGTPYIPGVPFRSIPIDYWGAPYRLDGLHVGTFFAAALSQMALYGAASDSFNSTILIGCRIRGGDIANPGTDAYVNVAQMPGGFYMLDADPEVSNPQAIRLAPADPSLAFRAVSEYETTMLANAGLRRPDTTRTNGGGNPTSAAALVVSDADRREAQRQMAPVFRPSDLALLSQIATLLNATTGASLPESGYSISYHLLPLSPEERAREIEEATAEHAAGLISTPELYRRFHPGTDIPGAIAAIVRAREEEAALSALLPAPPDPRLQAEPPQPPPTQD